MKDLPKDAWLSAIEALDGHGEIRIIEIIASAIGNERERCAKIADEYECGLLEYPSHEARTHYESGVLDAGMGISSGIRGTSSS